MVTFTVRSHVGKDGLLNLQVPVGMQDADVEVVVVLQTQSSNTKSIRELGYPYAFFEETFGSLPDLLDKESEGKLETRRIWNDLPFGYKYLYSLSQWPCPRHQRKHAIPTCERGAVCSVVKAELYFGAMKSSNQEKTLAGQNKFLDQFVSLPFDDQAAVVYGNLRARLSLKGIVVGPNDLLIASIAIANNLTLVTHNTRELGRIDELKLADWEAARE